MKTIKEGKGIKRFSKDRTNFRIFLLFCFSIIGLTVGYSALNEEVKITGEASVRPIRDVRITDIRLSETTNEGGFNYNNFNIDSINIGASLPKTNSTVTYEVDISNIGNVPVIVKSITPEYGQNSNIEYVIEGIIVGKTVINTNANKADDDIGKPTTIKVTVKYKSGITTAPTDTNANLKLTFEFANPSSILAQSSGSSDTSVFNNTSITKDKIETIEFKGTIDVPENIPESNIWDASLNKDSSVIAYYTVNSDTGLYNLVIGGYGKIEFPPISYYLFYKYASLKAIDFGEYIDTSKVTNMYSMFSNCSSLTSLDLSTFDTSKVTAMGHMFSDCSGLASLDLSNFNTQSVTNMSWMFGGYTGCKSLKELNLNNFSTSNVTNMSHMFHHCDSLQSLDLSNFDTSKVTDMSWMFMYCVSLANLNLNEFNTSSVTDMNRMFCSCTKLVNLDVSNFDTSKVTNMELMFSSCSGLTNLDLSNFNTSNVAKMTQMFSNCSGLTNLDVSNFDTSKVTNMYSMFSSCSGLTSLDLSTFDTSKVTNMQSMFSNCGGLINLNIKNFTFDKVTTYSSMLSYIPSSAIIYVKDQTAYDFINNIRTGNCTASTCQVCSNTGVTCP